jgi:acyl carrier protein|tara:strand:+ start:750 stop:1001 length:252 start_codon:yes stop_codon:yes gene_type:complete
VGVIMEVNEVFEKVKGLFEEELGIESEKITMEAKLEEDLEIDSLGIVEVVMAFEDEFEIEIDDEELTDVGTVGQAVNLLHSKL